MVGEQISSILVNNEYSCFKRRKLLAYSSGHIIGTGYEKRYIPQVNPYSWLVPPFARILARCR
jgi:hypothetical protein